MIDLKKISAYLSGKKLWTRPLNSFSVEEFKALINFILSSPDFEKMPIEGWEKPFLEKDGTLRITFNAHPKYQYWKEGSQPLLETLKELGASKDVIKKHTPTSYGEGRLKNDN